MKIIFLISHTLLRILLSLWKYCCLMQIIVDDHAEMKYYKRCLEQINNKYSQDIEINKCTIIDICDLCIEALVQDFITILDRYRNPQDMFQFMLLYSKLATEKQRTEDTLILMQMCRYVFMLIPQLNLSYKATPIIDVERLELSDIFFITKMIDILSQQRAIQLMNDESVFKLERNECAFALTYMDESIEYAHKLLKHTNQYKSLFQKHCFDYNLLTEFADELYNAFGDVSDKFCDIVCNVQPTNIHLNDVSFSEFKEIVEEHIPERLQVLRVINMTKLLKEHPDNDFLRGLLFTHNNSDIKTAIEKPYDKDLRTRYRPISEFSIDGNKEYYIAPYMFHEAIEEICGNLLPFKVIPNEWASNQIIINFAKKLFQEHDKWLEGLCCRVIEAEKLPYKRNVKALNNVSLEKAVAHIGAKCYPNRNVGEIDFIVIDKSSQIIYVIDAKHIKTRYHLQSFAADYTKFIGKRGYDEKLSFKVDWIQKHLYDVGKEFGYDYSGYSVQGLFVTETFVYYSISSQYPIIPIVWLDNYFRTNDKLCFIRQ